MVISIISAEYLGDYKIRFEFSDGSQKTIDFEGFLQKAKNPMTKKYLNQKDFKNFQLDQGDIMWNDYEMCFPIWDIYNGNI